MSKPWALVVEDHRHVRELTAMWLRDRGYQVLEAWTLSGWRCAWERRDDYGGFALVVTDNRFPRGFREVPIPLGLSVARKCRTEAKVIVFSADELAYNCAELGVGYLAKPAKQSDFYRVLDQVEAEEAGRA